MKRTLRFLIVLAALLGLLTMTQGALVGSCESGYGTGNGFFPCRD